MRAFYAIPAFVSVFIISAETAAQTEVPVPSQSLACLVEHQDKYLDLPRALIIFFPAFCPSIEREEVATLVENNAESGGQAPMRLMLSKRDFACLAEKAATHLAEVERQEDTTDTVTITLDCP